MDSHWVMHPEHVDRKHAAQMFIWKPRRGNTEALANSASKKIWKCQCLLTTACCCQWFVEPCQCDPAEAELTQKEWRRLFSCCTALDAPGCVWLTQVLRLISHLLLSIRIFEFVTQPEASVPTQSTSDRRLEQSAASEMMQLHRDQPS